MTTGQRALSPDLIVVGSKVLIDSDLVWCGRSIRGARAEVVSVADKGLVPEWVIACTGGCTVHKPDCWATVALRPDEVHLIPADAA